MDVFELRKAGEMQPVYKEPDFRRPMATSRIVQVVVDADLRLMIPGLVETCRKLGIDVEELGHGQLVVFVNRDRTMLKVLAFNRTKFPVLAVYRVPHGRILDLSIVSMIPLAFKAVGHVDFDAALRLTVEKYFERRKRRADLEILNQARTKV